ncbi:MAG: hypothetical protein SPH68_08240 [Candidatus Borkfalkiaceae bacterium]|nr:hypothetical protein [Clostridia bacterium]MDY6224128.1 hypothetical protein [Christensenellaceae bacterium]
MKILQILCTAVSAVCIAGFVPVATIYGWGYAAICAAGAVCFFALMLLFKQSANSKKTEVTKPHGDFFDETPPDDTDSDNTNGK